MLQNIVKGAVTALLALACTIAFAGCASTHANVAHTPYATKGGMSAASIASHVRGCTNVTAVPLTMKDDPGLDSVATCKLEGHRVVFDAFSEDVVQSGNESINSVAGLNVAMWISAGPGWMAFTADDEGVLLAAEDSPDQIAYAFAHPNGDNAQPDLPGEKAVAHAITESLSGSVHYRAAS